MITEKLIGIPPSKGVSSMWDFLGDQPCDASRIIKMALKVAENSSVLVFFIKASKG